MKKVRNLRFPSLLPNANRTVQHYHLEYEKSLASTKRENDEEAQKQFTFAKEHFQPLYYIRSYEEDKKKIEMSFDL